LACHAHGFAWAWSIGEDSDMPTQSRGHGT